jgi:lambda family phage portal protein
MWLFDAVRAALNRASPAAEVRQALPALGPISGAAAPQAGFMDGTDGHRSLTWARYSEPMFGYGRGYSPYGHAPGSEVSRERSAAAAVTLDLLTSNSTVATLVENLATYGVGNGLTLSSRPDHAALGISSEAARELSNEIERAWHAWVSNPRECDASGRHTFNQMATAAYKSYLLSGEVVVVLDWRSVAGAVSSTKVKLLDSRQLDQSITRQAGDDGLSVTQGVAFDKRGRLAGYWIRPYALGSLSNAPQAVFVRATTSWGRARAIHLFDLIAAGQIRGLPPLIGALSAAHAKGTLREYTLASALVQTQTATTIESDLPHAQAMQSIQPGDPTSFGGTSPEAWAKARGEYYTAAKVSLQPGVIGHLMSGDKLKMHRAESPNTTYDSFDKSLQRESAKAAGASYEDTSGDYSQTSFSASRLALDLPSRINERRRGAIVEPFYRAVFTAWLEEACETGRIKLPKDAPAFWEARDAYSRSVWRGKGKPVADPLKEAQAQVLRLENGLATYEEVLGENGQDFEEVLAQRIAEKQQLEAAGFQYPVPKNRDEWKSEAEPGDTPAHR